jgi:hypothetical protein
VTQLTPARDLGPARWLEDSLQTFGESVFSLVPAGFSSYVRVLHPAWRVDEHGMPRIPVRWADVALANGTRANPGMQFRAILGASRFDWNVEPQPGVFDAGPQAGSLPEQVVRALMTALSKHTATADHCWFAIWEGWGGLRGDIRSAVSFQLPSRGYHLLGGPLTASMESTDDFPAVFRSASLWWPDDRSWLVATEIDLESTYVGCSADCANALLAARELEAFAIDPTSRIDWYSDPVNPSPVD